MIHIDLQPTKIALGAAAAAAGAKAIRAAIEERGHANIIVATGMSQFELLAALVAEPGIDWSRVTAFHLDEYIGMPETHPASFRRYLKERFVSHLPNLRAFHFVRGDAADVDAEIERLNALIAAHPIDVTFAGIGENGHLAFNDPPADFAATEGYKRVELDEACRRQQFGEGWFPTLDDVPRQAISMTVQQIMRSALVILAVPDARKAEAVRATIEGAVTNLCPASILQRHPNCQLFLDPPSAGELARAPRSAAR
ncbi:MAG TPA: glucosamine-6-phosphate deaminase [Acetobacteraceae bacterium]|nr:glucosamine-6-phosphate deaminase [Acetobacteraceae bacterium]